MKPSYAEHALIFKALSDPTRLQILDMLSCGELCACDILEAFQITQPTLSYHMKILVESGIVQATPVGKWTHYHISEAGCAYAATLLHDLTATRTAVTEVCSCAAT